MREVYEDIFMEELALPKNPLKYLNLYLIKGDENSKNLVIDTGFNREDTKKDFLEAMKSFGMNFYNTNLFLTHLHSDHVGLSHYLEEKGMEIFTSKEDGDSINESVKRDGRVWRENEKMAKLQGLGPDRLNIEDHPGFKNRPEAKIKFTPIKEGDHIRVGKYDFQVVDLSGHTPGMLGLYEEGGKILFCADHILAKITPNITFWGFKYGDSLGTYLKNLDKCYQMDIDHLFSSHRYLIEDHRKRISELKDHHKNRLEEVRNILIEKGPINPRDTARFMRWDIKARGWEDFPDSQKWFAVGEAQAHLEHLRALGEVDMKEEGGILYYKKI